MTTTTTTTTSTFKRSPSLSTLDRVTETWLSLLTQFRDGTYPPEARPHLLAAARSLNAAQHSMAAHLDD
jgi:hypothetical protein